VGSTAQTKTGSLIIGGNLTTGSFTMLEGAGADKILTTDASGVATWQIPAGGSLWTQTGNNIYYNTGNVGIGTTTIDQKLTIDGIINMTSNKIINLATSTADTDAANKAYVDAARGYLVVYKNDGSSLLGPLAHYEPTSSCSGWAFWSDSSGMLYTITAEDCITTGYTGKIYYTGGGDCEGYGYLENSGSALINHYDHCMTLYTTEGACRTIGHYPFREYIDGIPGVCTGAPYNKCVWLTQAWWADNRGQCCTLDAAGKPQGGNCIIKPANN